MRNFDWDNMYSSVAFVVLVDSRLAHRRGVDRESCLMQKIDHLFTNTMTNYTSIYQYYNIPSSYCNTFVN